VEINGVNIPTLFLEVNFFIDGAESTSYR